MCPVYSLNALTDFLSKYYWLFGSFLLIFGTFLTFFGRKLFIFTVFLVGAMLTVFAVMILFYSTFLKSTTASWVAWLILSLSIVAGLGVGFLCTKVLRFAGALVCGFGGFMLGVTINEMWLYIYNSQVIFWCVSIGLAVLIFALAFLWFN